MGGGGIDQSDLAENGDRWQFLVNAVINFRVRQNARNFLIS